MTEEHQRIVDRLQMLHEWLDLPIDEQTIQNHLKQAGTSREDGELLVKLLKLAKHSLQDDQAQPAQPNHARYPSHWDRVERRVRPDRRSGTDRRRVPRSWDRRSSLDRRGNTLYRHRSSGSPSSE